MIVNPLFTAGFVDKLLFFKMPEPPKLFKVLFTLFTKILSFPLEIAVSLFYIINEIFEYWIL
jgi:hypothetical protein